MHLRIWHGADNAKEPVSKVIIGQEAIDVRELRGQVRTPQSSF
jgi:hypothetical protein